MMYSIAQHEFLFGPFQYIHFLSYRNSLESNFINMKISFTVSGCVMSRAAEKRLVDNTRPWPCSRARHGVARRGEREADVEVDASHGGGHERPR